MNKVERFKFPVAVHLFLIHGDKILLSRRFNTGYEDGNYALVSGHADGNETFTNAMIREAKEESNIDIQPEDLKLVHTMHRIPGREYIDFYFECRNWSGEVINMESDKCDELRWVVMSDLPENTVPVIRKAIENYIAGIQFSEIEG